MVIAYEFQRCLPQPTQYVIFCVAVATVPVVVGGHGVLMRTILDMPICYSTGGRRRNGVSGPSGRSLTERTSALTDYPSFSLAPELELAVAHQAVLAKRLANAEYSSVIGLPTADLTKRPFLLFWFMSLIERYVSYLCGSLDLTMCLTTYLSSSVFFSVALPVGWLWVCLNALGTPMDVRFSRLIAFRRACLER